MALSAREPNLTEPLFMIATHYTRPGQLWDRFKHDYSRFHKLLLAGQFGTDGLYQLNGLAHVLFDAFVILGIQQLFGDHVRPDAARHDTGTEPLAQGLFGRLDAAGRHNARPGHRTHHALDEVGTAHRRTREHLDDFTAQLLRVADLGGRTAAGAIRDAAPVTNLGDIRANQRANDELGAACDVDAGSCLLYTSPSPRD